MKTLTIAMPTIAACAATNCSYTVDESCQARAITVGDGIHPGCDTFVQTSHRVPANSRVAGVGACKVEACRHNRDLECEAASIELELHAEIVAFMIAQQQVGSLVGGEAPREADRQRVAVESHRSLPAMAASSSAASVVSRVNGPAWSSDEANAIIP